MREHAEQEGNRPKTHQEQASRGVERGADARDDTDRQEAYEGREKNEATVSPHAQKHIVNTNVRQIGS